ncbi:MarR family winged helix-turn-helix transcriptional regulator [Kordiimonas aestuarii]|uniref:MarR family winged helix-turn-helix transcriptional regulator n=1 Tax=Kordiimonas aestuarii TaxID=1005925 RepID=UPI0021D081E9|nr:MarR family transcriptional regulator [Kordiimonas aestuarii]
MTDIHQDPRYLLTWKLRRAFKLLGALSDQYCEQFDISAAERAMLERLRGWGPATVPDLARLFIVSRQNMQVRMNSLLEKGFIEKRPNPAHRRSHLITLSDKGGALFEQIKQTEATLLETLFGGIPASDIGAAHGLMDKLIANVLGELSEETNNAI